MNKVLTVTLLAAASSACLAQTEPAANFRLYGLVDAGVVHMTGVNNKNQVVSGIMEGTRFGIRGEEDLSPGWRAIFRLENRTEIVDGNVSNIPQSGSQVPDRLNQAALLGLPAALQPAVTGVAAQLGQTLGVNLPGRFWDRQAYVGLVTPVGAILAGRMYTPAYEINAEFDIMGTQSALSAGQVASIPASVDIRVNKALQYRIVLGGLTASAMYAFGEKPSNSKADRFGAAMVMYKSGPYAVGLGYNQRNNDIGQKSLRSTLVGGWMEIGPGTVSVMYGEFKDDNPSGVSTIATSLTPLTGATGATLVQSAFTEALKQDGTLMHLGYKMPMGGNTLYLSYSAFNDKRPQNADVASYGVAYSYALSKRTDINAVFAHFDNKDLAQAAPGQAGFLGGVTKSAGTDSNSIALGIRHRF
jgi:predicted porin